MHYPSPAAARTLFALVLFVLQSISPAWAEAPKWDPINPADLGATQYAAQPEIKAENLFVHETLHEDHREYYRRIKIYTADESTVRGTLSLTYEENNYIWHLFARVVKPDGNSSEYTQKDFRESVAVRSREGNMKKLTAAFTNVSDGDIIELKWSRKHTITYEPFLWGYCQDSIPTREYRVRILASYRDCSVGMFNVPNQQVTKPSQSQILMVAKDIPPYLEEPLGPPTKDVRGWYGVFYRNNWLESDDTKTVWTKISTEAFEHYKENSKPNSAIKAKSLELITGAASPEEKLRRLYDFCQKEIRNLAYFSNAELAKKQRQRENANSWDTADTFSKKSGFPNDVTRLFGSMARAAGFEVRLCYAASKRDTLNVTHPYGYNFINDTLVAVKLGQEWKLYAPGDYFVPAGMLHQSNEGVPYMRCENESLQLASSPIAPATSTPVLRKGGFELDEEGNLEGQVEFIYEGHEAIERKMEYWGASQELIDKNFREKLSTVLPNAEIGELVWANLGEPSLPVSVKFHLRVPGYAELIGARLALIPSVFARGEPVPFTSPTRLQKLVFDHAKQVVDEIEIVLPKNYVVAEASAPEDVLAPVPVITANYSVGIKKSSHSLVYKRSYSECADGRIVYQSKSYPAIKRLGELVHKSDNHSLMFKHASKEPSSVQPPPAPGTQP